MFVTEIDFRKKDDELYSNVILKIFILQISEVKIKIQDCGNKCIQYTIGAHFQNCLSSTWIYFSSSRPLLPVDVWDPVTFPVSICVSHCFVLRDIIMQLHEPSFVFQIERSELQ